MRTGEGRTGEGRGLCSRMPMSCVINEINLKIQFLFQY